MSDTQCEFTRILYESDTLIISMFTPSMIVYFFHLTKMESLIEI
jgi:hypothetical protein